jgi:serine/threonine-protein phosphatase 5
MLWSGNSDIVSVLILLDPQPLNGRAPNKRGVGIAFGPDVTKNFLQDNGLGYDLQGFTNIS